MNGFQFRTPGTIVAQAGSAGDPDTYKTLAHAGRTLLVTDATLQEIGLVGKVRAALEDAGAEVLVYDKVEAEPSAATVRDMAESARGKAVERVIGLGWRQPAGRGETRRAADSAPASSDRYIKSSHAFRIG